MAMSLLNMNDVSHLKYTHLKGMRRIGMGFFSSVYAEGDTDTAVTKLTVDEQSYQLLTCEAWRVARAGVETHFPRVLTDLGEVGSSRGNPVYAVELERLYPLSSKVHRALIRKWSKQYSTLRDEVAAYYPEREHNWILLSRAFCQQKAKDLDDAYHHVFEVLHHFLLNYGGALDIKPSNFMCREDGTLVWTDPVYDLAMLNRCTVVN